MIHNKQHASNQMPAVYNIPCTEWRQK